LIVEHHALAAVSRKIRADLYSQSRVRHSRHRTLAVRARLYTNHVRHIRSHGGARLHVGVVNQPQIGVGKRARHLALSVAVVVRPAFRHEVLE
jgi:hypothetical protein